jgi:hypothetical protein
MNYLLFFVFVAQVFAQNALFIEQSHRIYPFLEKMETYGFIELSSTKPFLLSDIKAKLSRLKKQNLSDNDRVLLSSFSSEFFKNSSQQTSVNKFWTVSGLKNNFLNLLSLDFDSEKEFFTFYGKDKNFVVAQIHLGIELFYEEKSARTIKTGYSGFGKINNFYFSVIKNDFAFSGDKNLNILYGSHLKNRWTKSAVSSDFFKSGDHSRGYLAYSDGENTLWLGRIPFEIGFGESGKFVINGFRQSIPSSFGYMFNFWKLRYVGAHFSLTAPELMQTLTENYGEVSLDSRKAPDKFLASHRFEIDIFNRIQLHYNELIVYGARSLDLNYLNPFSFLRPIEHELGDRDNALITLGAKIKIQEINTILYGDVILDEWKISEIPDYFDNKKGTWFGNKHGIMTGFTTVYNDFQFWAEHVAIAPWVYTHKFEANRFSHDGSALGYDLGPNSETLFLKLAHQNNPFLRFEISHKVSLKGHNLDKNTTDLWNLGGDLFYGRSSKFGELKDSRIFLEGNLERNEYSALRVKFFPNYYLDLEMEYRLENKKNHVFMFYLNMLY